MRKATNYPLRRPSNYLLENSIIGAYEIISGHMTVKTYHMSNKKNNVAIQPKIEWIEKVESDIKQLKSIVNVILEKLETRS